MSFDLESNAESERLLDDSNKLHLKVRTKEGSELEVALNHRDLVNDLKQAIISRLQLVDKNVRLIFSGKLLEPPSALLSSFKLQDGSYVHAVITNQSQHTSSSTEVPSSSSATRIDMANLRGLDTLMLPGPQRSALSIDEVASLRSYFHDDIVEYTRDNVQRVSGESDVDFIYRCETEWMNAQDSRSEFRLNLFGTSLFNLHPGLLAINTQQGSSSSSSSGGVRALQMSFNDDISGTPSDQGTMREFFCGLLMGFGCGYMMLFCMWDRNISQRQKMGILVGMILSLMLTMTMQNNDQRDGTASSKQLSGKTQEVPEIPVIDGSAGGMGTTNTVSS
jgi:hypothetical protein